MEEYLKRIKFLEALLASKDETIASKNETIASKDALLASKDTIIKLVILDKLFLINSLNSLILELF
jgi:hypothetical protein